MTKRPSRSSFISAASELYSGSNAPHFVYRERVYRGDGIFEEQEIHETYQSNTLRKAIAKLALKMWNPYLRSVIKRELEAVGKAGFGDPELHARTQFHEIITDIYDRVPLYADSQRRKQKNEIIAFLTKPHLDERLGALIRETMENTRLRKND